MTARQGQHDDWGSYDGAFNLFGDVAGGGVYLTDATERICTAAVARYETEHDRLATDRAIMEHRRARMVAEEWAPERTWEEMQAEYAARMDAWYAPPLRPNEPRAGATGYDDAPGGPLYGPSRDAPSDGWALLTIAVLLLVGAALLYAGWRYVQGGPWWQ